MTRGPWHDPYRFGDDWPPAKVARRRDRIVVAALLLVIALALVALAMLPGAPPEPGFPAHAAPTTEVPAP
jgi:hypothetical protein